MIIKDFEKILEIMEEYGIIGDEEYGGDGSDGEVAERYRWT